MYNSYSWRANLSNLQTEERTLVGAYEASNQQKP